MALATSSIETISMVIIVILIITIVILPDMLKKNTMITHFLEDNINVGLLVIIIILVSELNKVISVLLLLLFATMIVMTRANSVARSVAPLTLAPVSNIPLNNYRTEIRNEIRTEILKEKFVRDRVPVYPGQVVAEESSGANPEYDIAESPADFMNPPPTMVIEKFTCNSAPLNDLPTQQLLKAADGYDIAGCRYDNKNCAQNTSRYGAPLADCTTYDLKMAAEVGTVFYPLNA
jgi:hypothetical protein